jgi:hypothetical protein
MTEDLYQDRSMSIDGHFVVLLLVAIILLTILSAFAMRFTENPDTGKEPPL